MVDGFRTDLKLVGDQVLEGLCGVQEQFLDVVGALVGGQDGGAVGCF